MATRIAADLLFDATGGEPIEDGAMLCEGGRILAVGPSALVPRGEHALDFPGCTLMPGLVDAHTHISFNMGDQPVGELERGDTVRRALRATRYLQMDLETGVTLIRVVGEADFLDVAV